MLANAIVVAGDRTGADVHLVAHLSVAHVGEVAHLGAPSQAGLLELGEVAHMHAACQVRPFPQVREGPDGDILLEHRILDQRRLGRVGRVGGYEQRAARLNLGQLIGSRFGSGAAGKYETENR